MNDLLATTPYKDWSSTLAAADASHRAYWRLAKGDQTRMLMLAPPGLEDLAPFLRIGESLRAMGLHAPSTYYQDVPRGILVLEDLGSTSFRHRADTHWSELPGLYQLLLEVVLHLFKSCHTQTTTPTDASIGIRQTLNGLAPYDEPTLWRELMVFIQWYVGGELGLSVSATALETLRHHHRGLIDRALRVPSTLVLRDALIDNFMYCSTGDPSPTQLSQCGILDFQDALWGPVTYDLASFYHDARYDVPLELISKQMATVPGRLERIIKDTAGPHHASSQVSVDPQNIEDSFFILAALRNLKILGVFARLALRDNKPRYREHFTRIYKWLDLELHHPSLASLKSCLEECLGRDKLPFLR